MLLSCHQWTTKLMQMKLFLSVWHHEGTILRINKFAYFISNPSTKIIITNQFILYFTHDVSI